MASPHEPPPPSTQPRTGLTDAQRWTIGGLVAVVLLLLVVVLVLASGDDDGAGTASSTTVEQTTTTEAEPASTTEPEETTTTTSAPGVGRFDVAFPSPESSRRFEAPQGAARSYATDVLGFEELVLSELLPADGGGDVIVQPSEDGPETVVHLLQTEDAWWVTGSDTADVSVAQPVPGTSLASPFETSGQALAFEGNVQVLVLSQDDPAPLGQGVVTGSGVPPAGPFQADITFAPPAEPTAGVLVYRITSPEDGRVVAATSLRVRLTNLTT